MGSPNQFRIGPVFSDAETIPVTVTGTTAEVVVYSCEVPRSIIGSRGVLKLQTLANMTNSANNKTIRWRLNSPVGANFMASNLAAGAASMAFENRLWVHGDQYKGSWGGIHVPIGAAALFSGALADVDNIRLFFSVQLAVAGELFTLEGAAVEGWSF